MTPKFNILKSIKQVLIGSNILFPVAYLLFSAEVCSGGMLKNQPSNKISHTPPLSLAAKPVDQLNNIEGVAEADPNTDLLDLFHRDQSVIPVKIRKGVVLNDLVASQKKSVAHADKVAVLLSNQAQEDVSPEQSQETKVIDASNRPNENIDGSNHTDGPATIQQDTPPNLKPFSEANQTKANHSDMTDKELNQQKVRLSVLNRNCTKNCAYKGCASSCFHTIYIDEILTHAPTEYIVDLRRFVINKCLEASKGTYYFDKKVNVVEWFFNQPVQDIVQQYDRSILDLVIKQVHASNHPYSSSVMDSVQALMEKIG
ncbi:protein of unknown function [Cardinium endosymbiont cEper1 of Encarsia pergandiella]|uniref:hypothetical protein n=1 Tax=Cardinium endosymbiont of Encarsia pergandiella TaxID=249402 RepID=UPI00027EA788|nr:hypothetical protein [Cardinium endosymbiont of Encarsia pergandiella]CCM09788.1 protein of unknown function [Cardinium endosymbiont cEper1 of Encarsia pergandiella]